VFGKFMAALTLFTASVIITMLFPLMIRPYGELPVSQIVGSYLGYYFLGACYIALGMFISVLTNSQIIAAVGTFVVIFLLTSMDAIAYIMPNDTASSLIFVAALIIGVSALLYSNTKNIWVSLITCAAGVAVAVALYFFNDLIYDGVITKALLWLSVYARFTTLTSGVFKLADLVYLISFAVLLVYLTVNVIEKRRWK
jgi:ABC-2 type transport system permease protein